MSFDPPEQKDQETDFWSAVTRFSDWWIQFISVREPARHLLTREMEFLRSWFKNGAVFPQIMKKLTLATTPGVSQLELNSGLVAAWSMTVTNMSYIGRWQHLLPVLRSRIQWVPAPKFASGSRRMSAQSSRSISNVEPRSSWASMPASHASLS